MDTIDLSTKKEFLQYIQSAQANLSAAYLFKGQRPKGPRPSRYRLLRVFEENTLRAPGNIYAPAQSAKEQRYGIRQSLISVIYPPSIAPLATLKSIQLKELLLETQHRGSYIVLRTIAPSGHMVGVQAIVEDINGDCELLQLYNCWDSKTLPDIQDYLPKGQVLLIKEPYYKQTAAGGTSVRVDHISDLVMLDEDVSEEREYIPKKWTTAKKEPKTAMQWKEQGNKYYNQKKFPLAAKCYTKGLAVESNQGNDDSDLAKIFHLNRALAYLGMQHYDLALHDTSQVLSQEPKNEKALFRTAQAHYQARHYSECKSTLEALMATQTGQEKSAQFEAYKSLVTKVHARIDEEKTGVYDFAQMRKIVQQQGATEFDLADYTSPKITVKMTDTMGRGVFAVKDISAGELLMCHKACLIGHASKVGTSMLINVTTKEMCMGAQAKVTEASVKKLFWNPSSMKGILSMWSGDHERIDMHKLVDGRDFELPMVDGKPVVDTFLVDRIRALNAFGCPLITTILDDDRFVKTKSTNRFDDEDGHPNVGLWIMPSLINHSCWGNTCRSFIGDMMILRATTSIPAGTQITTSYMAPLADNDYNKRQKKLLTHWNFRCQCAYCIAEAAQTKQIREARAELRLKVKDEVEGAIAVGLTPQTVSLNKRTLSKIDKLISQLVDTYSNEPPASAENPRFHLALSYTSRMKFIGTIATTLAPEKLTEGFKFILSAWGYVIDDETPTGEVVIKQHGAPNATVSSITMHMLRQSTAKQLEARAAYGECAAEPDKWPKNEVERRKALYLLWIRRADGWMNWAKEVYEILVGENTSFDEFMKIVENQYM